MGHYTRLSDDELIARTADDREALGELYDRHVKAVLCERRGAGLGTEEALELTAEVFATALLASSRYRPGEARRRGGVRGSYGGCAGSVESVSRRLARRGAMWAGSSLGLDRRVNEFLVDGEVESLRVLGEGDWSVKMTPPWTAQAPGARALRHTSSRRSS